MEQASISPALICDVLNSGNLANIPPIPAPLQARQTKVLNTLYSIENEELKNSVLHLALCG